MMSPRNPIQMSSGVVGGGMMRMLSPKQLMIAILVVFSTLSFLKILLVARPSAAASARHPHPLRSEWDGSGNATGTARHDGLAAKELALLRSVVAARAPCRLLVFGLSPQLLALAEVNAGPGAATAFLTDSAQDADAARHVLAARQGVGGGSAAAVHRARYPDAAGEAWALLRRAREAGPACVRPTGTVRKSGCRLALTSLPREVLDARWDVVVVDGPSGAAPEEPGRMGAIYTAAALARSAGGEVDVAVHDVDRTVERWYATEYLCEDNLVAAKGRLWHFRVAAGGPRDAFCSAAPVHIL